MYIYLSHLSSVLDSVYNWLSSNYLCLNPTKTEFLLLGTPQQMAKITSSSLSFGSATITASSSARNLGVHFDQDISLTRHISSVCSSSFYSIKQLRQIRSTLDHKSTVLLANALVSSKLDHCNSLYYGLPDSSLKRLQLVQNSLARVIYPSVKCTDHITPFLRKLHWLPIKQRIVYKICLLTFNVQQTKAPAYLSELLIPYTPSRSLRSSDKHLLTVPSTIRSSAGRRSFSFAAPSLWNSLPDTLRRPTSLASFRSNLKTFLYPP